MRRTVILIILVSLLISCDCYQKISGIIIDDETGNPVGGVLVSNVEKTWNNTYTDSTGYFKLSNISGGFRCLPMMVLIESPNHFVTEVKIHSGKEEVIILKIK